MIVKNWDYDNLDLFKYWRISANAIYPFSNQDKVYLIRISPVEEKSEKTILAEFEFLNYLRDNSYSAIQAKLSRNGRELEVVNTPWILNRFLTALEMSFLWKEPKVCPESFKGILL